MNAFGTAQVVFEEPSESGQAGNIDGFGALNCSAPEREAGRVPLAWQKLTSGEVSHR